MKLSRQFVLAAGVVVLMSVAPRAEAVPASSSEIAPCVAPAQAPPPPRAPGEYYAIDLVPTGRVPGTAGAQGKAMSAFARSPFGVAVAPSGEYRQALSIHVEGLRARRDGVYVAWTASSDLQEVERLGVLDDTGGLKATVAWNKFLVIVSLERSADALPARWQGPIVMRGMSRSGLMHTMAGHGAYQGEPCVKYGYR